MSEAEEQESENTDSDATGSDDSDAEDKDSRMVEEESRVLHQKRKSPRNAKRILTRQRSL